MAWRDITNILRPQESPWPPRQATYGPYHVHIQGIQQEVLFWRVGAWAEPSSKAATVGLLCSKFHRVSQGVSKTVCNIYG